VSDIPPHDLSAERAVLGSLLIRADFSTLVDRLVPADFYRVAHQHIYSTMLEMRERNIEIDLVTLKAELEGSARLNEIGLSYLAGLTDGVPKSTNVSHYATVVIDLADRRRIEAVCVRALHTLSSAADADEALTLLMEELKSSVRGRQEADLSLASALTSTLQQLDNPIKATTTGIPALDRMGAGFRPGELTLLAGRPGQGKTALALHMAQGAAAANLPVWFASLEMTREALSMRWLASDAALSLLKMREGLTYSPDEYTRLSASVERLSALPISVDDHPALGLGDLRKAVVGSTGLLVVDYLQLIRPPKEARAYRNRVAEVGALSRGLKAIAHDCKVCVLALSQLNRAVEHRTNAKPLLSDLRDSGSLEQDADIVLLISRDEDDIILHVAKHRNGPVGNIDLIFDGATQRFRERTGTDPVRPQKSAIEKVAESWS
jgi:replicative DNA helicase|tara:strand:+ start:1604 stop:2911 length:1308 start_codon:yes stop_codon:yes gene_type:complete